MKSKLIICSALAGLLISCGGGVAEKASVMTVTGELTNARNQKIYLQERYHSGKYYNVDTLEMVDGKFSFTINDTYNRPARIAFADAKYTVRDFIVEEGDLLIKGDFRDIRTLPLAGTFCAEKEAKYLASVQAKEDSIEMFRATLGDAKNEEERSAIYLNMNKLTWEKGLYRNADRDSNLNNIYGISLLLLQMQNDYEHAAEILAKIPAEMQNNKFVDNLKAQIKDLSVMRPGAVCPDFKANTPEGEELALSAFKGKVVLVDFWASWCSPCRKSFPELKEIYAELHDKGFEVLAVSIDSDKAAWEKAIKDDKLVWNHISTLKGWDCPIFKSFFFSGVPSTILLDREGKIVAKNLHGEELKNKISELL